MNLENMVIAADAANMQAGGKSGFEDAVDSVTGSVAGAVASAWTSLYNTGAWYSNKLFNADTEMLDTERVLTDVNANWGKYYSEHKEVLDTVGFIAGSFIPGGLAVKGLKAVQTAGKAAGTFGTVLGYTARGQAAALETGLKAMAETGPSVVGAMHQARLATMTWGVADQVLQTAVFEVATVAAMHQAPTLRDESSTDILWDMTKTTLAGGLIGGGVEALFTNKIFKDATKAVDKQLRKVDVRSAIEELNAGFGDKAFAIVDSVMDLPEAFLKTETKIPFNYSLGGKKMPTVELDISKLADKKVKDTIESALLHMQSKIANVVPDDTSIGSAMAAALVDIARKGFKVGADKPQIRQELANVLLNLEKVQGLGGPNIDLAKDVIYFTPGAKLGSAEQLSQVATATRVNDKQLGYRLFGEWSDVRGEVLGKNFGTIDDAFKNGLDIAITPAGEFHVNPLSERLKRITDTSNDDYLRAVYHVRSGTIQDSAMATIADVATTGKPLTPASITPTGITSGNYTFKFSVFSFKQTEDNVAITARHAWASQGKNLDGVTIDSADFSLLTAAMEQKTRVLTVLDQDGVKIALEDPTSIRSFILDQKVLQAKKMADAKMDSRVIENALSVENGWLEKAAAVKFDKAQLYQMEETWRPLKSYLERDNLVLMYNKAGVTEAKNKFPDGILAYNSRVGEAIKRAETAAAAVLGEANSRFPGAPSAATASSLGAGPTFLGASNADYGDALQAVMQASGLGVQMTSTELRNAALSPLQPLAAKIISSNNLNLGATIAWLRKQSDAVVLDVQNSRFVDLAWWESPKRLGAPSINMPIKDADTLNFLAEYQRSHSIWDDKNRALAGAAGKTVNYSPAQFYVPPINTRQYPYFAFVRDIEGRAFSSGEVSMVTARSQDELSKIVDTIRKDHPQLQIITKDQNIAYHKAKGDYEFGSGLNSPDIDSLMKKKGILADFMPTMEPTAVVNEFVDFVGRREDKLVRNAVSLKYQQTFAELRYLSEKYTQLGKSKFAYVGKSEARKVDDPFGDYIRLALNVPKDAEYTFWHDANAFVDSLGQRAYREAEKAYMRAKKGEQTFEEANKQMEAMGIPGPFASQESYITSQVGNNGNLIKSAVAKGNMLLSTIGLRLDMANALVNVLSTPMMLSTEISAIKSSLKNDPAVWDEISSLMRVKVPGQELQVPSHLKLLTTAVGNYLGPTKDVLVKRYKDIGAIKDLTSQFHEMIADMALLPNMNRGEWAKKVEKWTEKGATMTGNNWAEEFTRFVSADVMRQITDPMVAKGLMGEKEQNAFMQIFVNRVQGNYVASQRPIAFQGTLGAALSLFQTYQFNLLQQLFRHIENKDARTLAIAGGLQTTMFGLNGLPLFDAINTHLIGNASINEGHHDAYSSMVRVAGKEWGDWLMYGTASALPLFADKSPSLYTRGDLNPRHITVLPNPMNPSEIPIVSGLTRVVGAVAGMGKQLLNGADVTPTLLFGLEHNGVSRPLAGLAQVLQGYSTTSKGSLIAANNDMLSIASASRILGAKPMDESVALNHMYRLNAYKAFDRQRIEGLGMAVKEKMRNGTFTSEDSVDFMARYAADGGRIEGYTQALQRWMKEAKQSTVNKVMTAHKSATGQRLLEVMGADKLDDLTSQPEIEQ